MVKETSIKTTCAQAWEPPSWKRKYMYTNSDGIPYYFKYLEYPYLNVTFWSIMGEDNFFISDLKKLICDLHEYITSVDAIWDSDIV